MSGERKNLPEGLPQPDRREACRALAGLLMLMPAALLSANGAFAAAMSAAEFRRQAERLLGVSLPPGFAQALYHVFREEPWGLDHLRRLQRKLLDSQLPPEKAWQQLDDGERWFLDHFLTTCVTGVYYHERGNRLISYEQALMHALLLDIRPVPGLSDRAFGFWSRAPER